MTRIMTFAAMSLALLSATAEPRCEAIMSVQGETASLLPLERKFKLVWHDEFDGDRLDGSK